MAAPFCTADWGCGGSCAAVDTGVQGRTYCPPLWYQYSGASGVLRYSRGLPSASTSSVIPPELPAQ